MVGYEDEVYWPLGRGEEGRGEVEFRWDIRRGEAHLAWCKGGKDFYVFVGDDVGRAPRGVVPPGEDKEAKEWGVVRR
jgi:hypothetical protein